MFVLFCQTQHPVILEQWKQKLFDIEHERLKQTLMGAYTGQQLDDVAKDAATASVASVISHFVSSYSSSGFCEMRFGAEYAVPDHVEEAWEEL